MSHGFQPFHPTNRSRVAVVTGGNKGVGYSVVKKLLKKFRGVVYLTARHEDKGLAACEHLKKAGLHAPKFYQLDITDKEQIMEFRQHLQKTYGGIDVLINYASVPHKTAKGEESDEDDVEHEEHDGEAQDRGGAENVEKKPEGSEEKQNNEKKEVGIKIEVKVGVEEKKVLSPEEKIAEERRLLAESYRKHKIESHPSEEFWVPKVEVDPRVELAETTLKTNVIGTLNVIHCLLPLFRQHGRIINISSSLGVLSSISNDELREKFANTYLMESELMDILQTYIVDVKHDKVEEKGWPSNVWILSKLAINLMTRILARDHKYDERKDILITSCCPDLSEDSTPLTADQGAETPFYLAVLAKGEKNLHGKIFKDQKIMEWE
ncbi:carbonyl reductase [NADPH] 3-like [Dendronephthya gigantea]|uniref:carbonyl reductase [NADPH] 3-like n=1 Tax=Dendronephthya gigantea TaxID=151771 RepID=UPI00106CF283|nr:carbonyl reductase [NADPH] 3-like [Dendronephthya gigantea]